MNDTYRIICYFDREAWEEYLGQHVIHVLGGSVHRVFDHALNVFPWTGYTFDYGTTRKLVENAVFNSHGTSDGMFDENVDMCISALWDLVGFIRQNIGQPRIKDSFVTGGYVESMTDQDVTFELNFDGI